MLGGCPTAQGCALDSLSSVVKAQHSALTISILNTSPKPVISVTVSHFPPLPPSLGRDYYQFFKACVIYNNVG